MKVARRLTLVVLGLLLSLPSWARAQADFSGEWVLHEQTGGVANPAPGSITMTLIQSATDLRIVRNGEVRAVYRLDGSDSSNSVVTGRGAVERISRARWQGTELAVTTYNPDGSLVNTAMYKFNEVGQLVVTTSTEAGGGITIVATYAKRGAGWR